MKEDIKIGDLEENELYHFQYPYISEKIRTRVIIICSKRELSSEKIESIGSTWSVSIKHMQKSFHDALLVLVDENGIDHARYLLADTRELRDPN